MDDYKMYRAMEHELGPISVTIFNGNPEEAVVMRIGRW